MTITCLRGKLPIALFLAGAGLLTTAPAVFSGGQAPAMPAAKIQIKVLIDGKEVDLDEIRAALQITRRRTPENPAPKSAWQIQPQLLPGQSSPQAKPTAPGAPNPVLNIRLVADPDYTTAEWEEFGRARIANRFLPTRDHGGRQRIPRERVEHVGHQQFLMLLLVMEAKFDQTQRIFRRARQQSQHGIVDMGSIFGDAGRFRARQQAAHRPRVTRAHRLVVRVEQETKILVEHAVILA